MTPNPLPTVLSATKPIPALRALRPGALPLLLTGVLALPATPQQPSAPLTTATETAEHNEDRHHLEEAASKEERPREIQNGIGMEFVLIPAGTFRMGGSGLRADPSEKPRHEVTITRPFYIGKYEVTQGQWQAAMGSNPSFFDECGERCPVDSVSLIDAQGLAGRLNEMEGTDSYRLPTEAEWEYAARAGSKKSRYGPVDKIAWHRGNDSDRTHPLSSKRAMLLQKAIDELLPDQPWYVVSASEFDAVKARIAELHGISKENPDDPEQPELLRRPSDTSGAAGKDQ